MLPQPSRTFLQLCTVLLLALTLAGCLQTENRKVVLEDDLKKEKELTIIIMAHTPKKLKFTPMQMNDLAGSAAIQNFVQT